MSLKISPDKNFLFLYLPYNNPLLTKQYENDFFEIYKINQSTLSTFLSVHHIDNVYLPFSDIMIYKTNIMLSIPFKLILVNKNAPFVKIANNFVKTTKYDSIYLYQPTLSTNYINLGLVIGSLNKNNYCIIDKDMITYKNENERFDVRSLRLKPSKYGLINLNEQKTPHINFKKINKLPLIEKFNNELNNESNIELNLINKSESEDKKSISGEYVELTTSDTPWFRAKPEDTHQIFIGNNDLIDYNDKLTNDKYSNFLPPIRTHELEKNYRGKPYDTIEYFGDNKYSLIYILLFIFIIIAIYLIFVNGNNYLSNIVKSSLSNINT